MNVLQLRHIIFTLVLYSIELSNTNATPLRGINALRQLSTVALKDRGFHNIEAHNNDLHNHDLANNEVQMSSEMNHATIPKQKSDRITQIKNQILKFSDTPTNGLKDLSWGKTFSEQYKNALLRNFSDKFQSPQAQTYVKSLQSYFEFNQLDGEQIKSSNKHIDAAKDKKTNDADQSKILVSNLDKPCGDIKVAVYRLDTLGAADKIIPWVHGAVLVCGVEIHYDADHKISICEKYSKGSKELKCTYDTNPEKFLFEEEGVKVVSNAGKSLKDSSDKEEAQKTFNNELKYYVDLKDVTNGKNIKTNMSLREVLQTVELLRNEEDGKFRDNQYHMVFNNCLDFSSNFLMRVAEPSAENLKEVLKKKPKTMNEANEILLKSAPSKSARVLNREQFEKLIPEEIRQPIIGEYLRYLEAQLKQAMGPHGNSDEVHRIMDQVYNVGHN